MIGSKRPIFDKEVGDILLLHYFIGKIPINTAVNSPLRKDDKPSFQIVLTPNNRIYWWDYVTQEKGNIYDLLERYLSLSKNELNDLIENNKSNILNNISSIDYSVIKKKCDIRIKIRQLNEEDIEYWESYGVNHKNLKTYNVFPISYYYLNNTLFYSPRMTYSYCEKIDGKWYYKIYHPGDTKFKWISNMPFNTWSLISSLPKTGDILILSKSTKDAMCIMNNSRYHAISLQGEGAIPEDNDIESFKKRFNRVILWYDNDFNKEKNWGRMFSDKLSEKFNITKIEIPDFFEEKDISDFHKTYGKLMTQKLITKLVE